MSFDMKQFMGTKFQPRTAQVPIPGLREFFAEGSEPVFTVRGLTGQELGICEQEAANRENIAAVVEALAGGKAERIEAIKELVGLGDSEISKTTVKQLSMICRGAVNPELDLEAAAKLCRTFPIEFTNIVLKIMELTGQGQEPGKKKHSGTTPK